MEVRFWSPSVELCVIKVNDDYEYCKFTIRQNEKVMVFRVTGLKNLGRVGTHIFVCFSLQKK